MSVDDTRVWRPCHQLPGAQWHRDPLGPACHTNLCRGLRFQQAALILPLFTKHLEIAAHSLPTRWVLAAVVKQPGKNAAPKNWCSPARRKS